MYGYTGSTAGFTAAGYGDLNGDSATSTFLLKGEVTAGIVYVSPNFARPTRKNNARRPPRPYRSETSSARSWLRPGCGRRAFVRPPDLDGPRPRRRATLVHRAACSMARIAGRPRRGVRRILGGTALRRPRRLLPCRFRRGVGNLPAVYRRGFPNERIQSTPALRMHGARGIAFGRQLLRHLEGRMPRGPRLRAASERNDLVEQRRHQGTGSSHVDIQKDDGTYPCTSTFATTYTKQ